MSVEAYWGAVKELDRERCWRLAEAMIQDDRGDELLEAVGYAQRQVGEEWASARWSVAQEHAATAINDAVLGLLEAHDPRSATRGTVAVLCVEDEWHSMPARLLSLSLRRHGWETLFFGASLPADHVDHFATGGTLTGIAVSCTMPPNLYRVRELAARLAGTGAPLLGGGIGFGPDGRWAVAAGVDAYAASAADASRLLSAWTPGADHCVGPQAPAPRERLHAEERVRSVMALLEDRLPVVRTYDERQRRHTVADVGHILDYLDATALTGDEALFATFADWLQVVLTARGVPVSVLPISLDCVAAALSDAPEAAARAHSSAARLHAA